MKDRLTPMAIGGALVCVLLSMIMDGGNPAVLMKPAPLILVFGGTFAVSLAGLRKRDLKGVKTVFKQAMGSSTIDMDTSIEAIVNLSKVAKQSNVMALENYVRDVDDQFLHLGIQLVVDGSNSEEIREILENEIDAMQARHRAGSKFFTDMGGFAPTLGILGTVIGLVHVLGSLSNPGSLGPAIASAFTATLWGVLSANLFWLPIANKLQQASATEARIKLMQVEGLLALQAGGSSRVVRLRMEAFLPSASREDPFPDRRKDQEEAA
ncbi:MAG: motility protein A [Acidimicrobiales bacterium]